MWIQILKTHKGPLGLFLEGCKYDLYPHIVKQLPADYFKEIAAMEQEQEKQQPTDDRRKTKYERRVTSDNRQKAIESSPKDKQMRPDKDPERYKTK